MSVYTHYVRVCICVTEQTCVYNSTLNNTKSHKTKATDNAINSFTIDFLLPRKLIVLTPAMLSEIAINAHVAWVTNRMRQG